MRAAVKVLLTALRYGRSVFDCDEVQCPRSALTCRPAGRRVATHHLAILIVYVGDDPGVMYGRLRLYEVRC